MVTYQLALEADDVFFGSVRSVKFFQILMNTAYQIRMVSFESPCRVQHILDGLLQPCAVCIVRKCLLHFLNDGGNLFGQQFLFNGRYGRRALVTESIRIPVLVMDYKRRNNLYIHVLLTDTETDVRGRGTVLFQIDGNFHRQCVFDSHCKDK